MKTNDAKALTARLGPGPGAYTLQELTGAEGAKQSIIPRRPLSANPTRSSPGPGAYTPGLYKNGPAYKIGHDSRNKPQNKNFYVPGPGTYDPGDRLVSYKQASPGWGYFNFNLQFNVRIGTSRRLAMTSRSFAPGPGSYYLKGKLGEGPKHSMRPRTAVVLKHGGPGPGEYAPSKKFVLKRPPSAVMGNGTREGKAQSAHRVPGPGSYLQSEAARKGPSYSFTGSRADGAQAAGPGPGSYRIPCTFASLPKHIAPKASEFEYV